jgi:P-type E1-E2 ATPase
LKATRACVVEGPSLTAKGETLDIELVQLGDYVKVMNGAQVPIDGVVAVGSGLCNESMLTGEAKPVKKEIGSKVFGGSILTVGTLVVKVEKLGENATINQIIKLVESA